MTRRTALSVLGGLVLAGPGARAQAPARIYRIGILGILPRASERALREALARLGYIEGQNTVYDARYSGRQDLLGETAEALVAGRPDVIITAGGPASEAAKRATRTIPIVLWGAGDPVATGLVANISHPESNITGVTELSTQLTGKRLQLFQEAVGGLRRVAVIWNAEDRSMALRFDEASAAAPQLGLALVPLPVRDLADFDKIFDALLRDRPDGVLVVSDRITLQREKELIAILLRNRLPSIFEFPSSARNGGLMSYGPSLAELAPRAAAFVDRLLKGARPGDLPLESPSRLELIVNLRTAAAIDLTIPQTVTARASEIIE